MKKLLNWILDWRVLALLLVVLITAGACVSPQAGSGTLHRWWAGLGPVLPHDTFPGDCKTCHAGSEWNTLRDDFEFDHEQETGFALQGAHAQAQCLRCHNDRGPVKVFQSKGCVGCHEDLHQGKLGNDCTSCHTQKTWFPVGQIEKHARTRFPLTGAHAQVSCHRCHAGARVGRFVPQDTECLTCHARDFANTQNPPHLGLGWVDNCDRCHLQTRWQQATINEAQAAQMKAFQKSRRR